MCVYDVIAASQQGACFGNLGRRLQISEQEASTAVETLLPVVTPALLAWIGQRDGMVQFLSSLGTDDLADARGSPTFFSDNRFRDRGIALLRKWREAGSLDSVGLAEAAAKAGMRPDTAAQLLPWLAVLLMSAIQLKAQRPLGQIAQDLDGDRVENPFVFLASRLNGLKNAEPKGPAVRRLFGALMGLEQPSVSARPA